MTKRRLRSSASQSASIELSGNSGTAGWGRFIWPSALTGSLANVYVRIGETAGWQGELEKAEQNILKGLRMIEPLVQKNPNNAVFRKSFWTANLKAGEAYLDQERFDESLKYYEKALEWIEKSLRLFLELKARGALPEADNDIITGLNAQIADLQAGG